jgi:hypothetical protein
VEQWLVKVIKWIIKISIYLVYFSFPDIMKLIISTKSQSDQNYKVTVQMKATQEITIQPGKNNSKTGWISPTSQQLFQFHFSGHIEDQFLLKVSTNDENPVCSLVSVQPLENCLDEVYDEEKDMRYGDKTVFQTMLKVTAIVIEKKIYPKGINIVLLSKSSDSDCYMKSDPTGKHSNQSMEVTVSIERMVEDPVSSTWIVLTIYILIGLLSACLSFFSFRRFGVEYDSKFGTYEINLESQLIINSDHIDDGDKTTEEGMVMKMFQTQPPETDTESSSQNLLSNNVLRSRQP